MNFSGNFLLVNSLHLIIGNVEPNIIKLGESVSVSTLLHTLKILYSRILLKLVGLIQIFLDFQ